MRVEAFSLALSDPLVTAGRTVIEREGFLLDVEVDGSTGVGEATPLAGWTEAVEECQDALEALDAPDPDVVPADRPAARHGVDLAVADAAARAAGRPLYRYLAGPGRGPGDERVERVPVNATVGDAPPEETADRGAAAAAEGFPALKVKVGARGLDADRERLAAVRARCHDVELRADANGAWDRETAAAALEAFADLDVRYVEQPLAADDLAGLTELSGGPVGVAADEAVATHGVEAVLDAGVDLLVVKPMVLGGPRPALGAARRARTLGVEPVVTTTIDGAVARTAAVHVAAAIPDVAACGLATADRLTEDLGPDPAPVVDGAARVPQKEGNSPPFTWLG